MQTLTTNQLYWIRNACKHEAEIARKMSEKYGNSTIGQLCLLDAANLEDLVKTFNTIINEKNKRIKVEN